MTSLSIVLTVFVLQLHHVGPNQKPVPRWLKCSMVDVIAHLLCMSNYVENYYGNSRRHAYNDVMQHKRQHSRRRHNGHQRPQQKQFDVTSSQYSNLMTSPSADQLQDLLSSCSCDRKNSVSSQQQQQQHINCNGDANHTTSIPLLTLNTHDLDPELACHPQSFDLRRRGSRSRDEQMSGEVGNQLRILVSKREGEDEHEDIVNEWRLIAHICDRLLFWIFFVGAVVSTLTILVIMPMLKPPFEEL